MSTPSFCVKFTNDTAITVHVDVAAKDAAAAIVAASDQLVEVFVQFPGFRPVEVYPVEIR